MATQGSSVNGKHQACSRLPNSGCRTVVVGFTRNITPTHVQGCMCGHRNSVHDPCRSTLYYKGARATHTHDAQEAANVLGPGR